jgi:hypothetical protein
MLFDGPGSKNIGCWMPQTTYVLTPWSSGFSGLVVSMLASGIQVCGFKPGRSCQIFLGVKILSMPSFRREVKLCHRFAARKGTLFDYVEV